jgi:hypothetical protein
MKRQARRLVLMWVAVPVVMLGFYEKHRPTPAEQKAITKYAEAVNKVLDQFRSDEWDETIDYNIDNPMVNPMPDRPLDVDELIQRTYHVRPGSRRYQAMILPRMQAMAQEKDLTRKQLLGAQVQDLMHLQVQVHCNLLVVPMITGPDSKHDPKTPGATFVHQDRNNPFGHGVAYVLFFSNGRAGRWEEANDVYRNFFVHPPNTPFIENLEIRIYGSEDRIQELLRKIDWKQVNAALTM